jgi:uncharacterized membrane protein YfcA
MDGDTIKSAHWSLCLIVVTISMCAALLGFTSGVCGPGGGGLYFLLLMIAMSWVEPLKLAIVIAIGYVATTSLVQISGLRYVREWKLLGGVLIPLACLLLGLAIGNASHTPTSCFGGSGSWQ